VKKLSVAIIGAGMGGLATAAALRRVGIDVTVYEQARRFARVGAGIQISFNAMKVLRTFGLEPNLRAAAFYPRSWNNRNFDTGEIRFDMIFGETAERRYGAPYLLAHRGDLHAALASAMPDSVLRLDHQLVSFEQRADGSIRLDFANGMRGWRRRHSLGRQRHAVRRRYADFYRPRRLPHCIPGNAAERIPHR